MGGVDVEDRCAFKGQVGRGGAIIQGLKNHPCGEAVEVQAEEALASSSFSSSSSFSWVFG